MPCRIDLFCEDAAHEAFGRALIERRADEEGLSATLHVPTAKFGIPRLKAELRAFQAVLRRAGGAPDLLVILVDANDVGVAQRRSEVENALDSTLYPHIVVGVPDPYIERWMVADPVSFSARFGVEPDMAPPRSREDWKERLTRALEASGEIVTQGGAEFADDIVSAMDLYRAGQTAPSFRTFLADLASAMRLIAHAS
jgi:hypothetical protein